MRWAAVVNGRACLPCKSHPHMRACSPIHFPPFLPQTSRAEIQRKVEHGEELLSRFRHWEPLTREWCRVSVVAVNLGPHHLFASPCGRVHQA